MLFVFIYVFPMLIRAMRLMWSFCVMFYLVWTRLYNDTKTIHIIIMVIEMLRKLEQENEKLFSNYL